jgi:DNA-directed RNA polymerase specialized sigma24 family protein
VTAVLTGDREAYRQIILLCEARVRLILAAILPDSDKVDDIAQEVFVTAYSKLVDYRAGSDLAEGDHPPRVE